MEPSTRTLAPITSTNEAKASMSPASSTASRTSDSPSKSPLWRLPPDVLTNLQPSYWTRRSSHGPPDGGPAGAVPPAVFVLATQRDAQSVAPPQAVGARVQPPYPAAAKDAGGRQHQARLGHLGHHGPQRSGNDRGLDCRRKRSRAAGPVGPSPDQSAARGALRSAARPRHPASPAPVAPASKTDRRGQRGDRRHRSGGRRSDRALSHRDPTLDHHSGGQRV